MAATESEEILNQENSNTLNTINEHENGFNNTNGNLSIKSNSLSTVENGNNISNENINLITSEHGNRRDRSPNSYFIDLPDRKGHVYISNDENSDKLGSLPQKWEKAYTENGEAYFIDHNTGTSHWLDPRLSKFQKKSLEDCLDNELPYGWEKIHDPQYGTYFIDHVNRRTQYENPVLEAKRRVERNRDNSKSNSSFTRNPSELCGERITTTLLKSSRGLGFTIVGGDDDTIDEFLQIKSIIENGPAWLDGKLQTGDILVYVNDICVLGFTHHDMVNVFQSILPGETVTLEVCRGYPLPFDPNDPNTEVVTTIAVDSNSSNSEKTRMLLNLHMDGNYNFLDISDSGGQQKNPLTKIQTGNRTEQQQQECNEKVLTTNEIINQNIIDKPEVLNISIIKGAMGFGFTIADSAHGQKVKKILDRNCCKNLIEGDILLTINLINVKNMTHSEVVQVLKDCPKSQEAHLKVQRVPQYSTVNLAAKTNNKLRKNAETFNNTINNRDVLVPQSQSQQTLYRSKTPTADLYSTQPKEILPTRPKTPLVDTRNRIVTPLLNETLTDEIDSKNNDDSKILSDTKSNNSYHDQDSIINDIPSMDPFPKFVTHLTERLAQTNLMNDHHQLNMYDKLQINNGLHHPGYISSQSDLNYDQPANMEIYNYNNNSGGYSNIYSSPQQIPIIMAPIPTYHQDTCFCYECQDYNRQHQEFMLQQQYNHTNNNNNKFGRLLDRRKTGLEGPPYPSPTQQQEHNYWKYGQPSPNQQQLQLQQDTLLGNEEYTYTLSEVMLERQSLGFGFRIVGGTEEGSQVTVGHIVKGGSADRDPRIQTGDEILSIDGINVVNASHHRVVQLMGEAALNGQVKMILRRKSRQITRYPYDVIVNRNENEGFGFVIISSSNQFYGSTIGKLIAGSPADRCNELKIGDRITAVNRMDIIGKTHGDVVNLIKESGLHVRLTIGNPHDPQIPKITQTNKNEIYFERFPML